MAVWIQYKGRLAERFYVHPNQITEWKKQLLERAEGMFMKDKKTKVGVIYKSVVQE